MGRQSRRKAERRQLFDPATGPTARPLVEKARRTNIGRDKIERRHGFASPSAVPLDIGLRTVLSALACGLEAQDWDCVAEAYAMLQDIELKVGSQVEDFVPPPAVPLPMSQIDAQRVFKAFCAHQASLRLQVMWFLRDGGAAALGFHSADEFLEALYGGRTVP